MRGRDERPGKVPLVDETKQNAKELGGKVTFAGCVLESTPTWFLVGTIECSCGTGRRNKLPLGFGGRQVLGSRMDGA